MERTLTLTFIMISLLALNMHSSQQNTPVKTPQENTNSHEGIRSLLRQKDQMSPRRKVSRLKRRALKPALPTPKESANKPGFHDYPLLRQTDEKAPVDKNR
jgi:hypothetical protein